MTSEPTDELIARYDERGEVVGEVVRSVMRRENLWHAASSVVVRDPLGRIYLHRRTTMKDVYPGLLDFAAGGVVLAGEDPALGAVRETEEELGVHGVPLDPLGVVAYADKHTRYHAHRFTCRWDGPVRWQPEEVSWGDWVLVDDLLQRVEAEPETFVPDSAAVWDGVLRGWQADRALLPQGWDSEASLVEGRWVDRSPRRPEVERQLLCEAALLPLIGNTLGQTGIEVPRPSVVRRDPLVVRHPLVVGGPADPERLSAADGDRLGRFLSLLHATADSVVTAARLPSAAEDLAETTEQLERLRVGVLPLLDDRARVLASSLLEAVAVTADRVLCHADLHPEHVLVRDGAVAGIIDWGDARVTDPAIDLAWPLHGTNGGFAHAVRTAYGTSDDIEHRSRAWWALEPWFDVHRDVFLGDDAALAGDLDTLTERLRWWHQP